MRGLFRRRFPFRERSDTAALACCHVLDGAPVLRVTHDVEDGMWQFLCGSEHDADQARVIALQEACDLVDSVGELADMPCGCIAIRRNTKEKWQIIQA